MKTVRANEEPIMAIKAYSKDFFFYLFKDHFFSESRLFVGTTNGNVGFFKMNKEDNELYGPQQDKPFPDHAGDINLLVLLPQYKLVLTYSNEDNNLKVKKT